MCEICDGASADDVVETLHREVLLNGFTMVFAGHRPSWAYTIGLARLAHPELVVANLEPAAAAEVLSTAAGRVLRGARLKPDWFVEHDGLLFGLAAVHPTRIAAGLCAMWSRYDEAHPQLNPLEVLQIRVPDECFCACHKGTQPRLDLAGGRLGPPRQERRRRRPRSKRAKRR